MKDKQNPKELLLKYASALMKKKLNTSGEQYNTFIGTPCLRYNWHGNRNNRIYEAPKTTKPNITGVCQGIKEHIFDIRPNRPCDYAKNNKEVIKHYGITNVMTLQKPIEALKLSSDLIIKPIIDPNNLDMYN